MDEKALLHRASTVKILHDKDGNKIRVWSAISLYDNILDSNGNYGCGIYKAGGYNDRYGHHIVWDSMECISKEKGSKITELEVNIQETIKRYPFLQTLN